MHTSQASTVLQHRPRPALRLKGDPWPLAAGGIALLVATPIVVVVSSVATPSVEIWAHLRQADETLGFDAVGRPCEDAVNQ